MFGPKAQKAVQTYKAIKDDIKLQGLLVLFGSIEKMIASFKVKNANAYGYDKNGKEVVMVPIEEHTYIRKLYDDGLKAFRHNTP